MAQTTGGPICPYCEKWLSDGPAIEDYASDIRVAYCPHCRKVLAVIPLAISTYD